MLPGVGARGSPSVRLCSIYTASSFVRIDVCSPAPRRAATSRPGSRASPGLCSPGAPAPTGQDQAAPAAALPAWRRFCQASAPSMRRYSPSASGVGAPGLMDPGDGLFSRSVQGLFWLMLGGAAAVPDVFLVGESGALRWLSGSASHCERILLCRAWAPGLSSWCTPGLVALLHVGSSQIGD